MIQTGHHRQRRAATRLVTLLALLALLIVPAGAHGQTVGGVNTYVSGFDQSQIDTLHQIALDSWKFYSVDIDPATNLPMDNVTFAGGSSTPTSFGRYTSAANIGVYFWAVVAAYDLGLISRSEADARLNATLQELHNMQRFRGFLYQWYSTKTGDVTKGPPNNVDCSTDTSPTFGDVCIQISQVDNGWYASGLIVVRQAFPELKPQVNSLLAPMNFGIFYDNGPESSCNVFHDPTNPSNPYNNQPTGQMYGVYFVGFPPSQNEGRYYHNGAFYSDPRITAYIGMGLRQMPGNVWWRSWRVLPPKAPYDNCQATDPDFSWTGQGVGTGSWQDYIDPQSGKVFHVWEGHYTYPTDSSLTFIPTWAGGMFEGLMANEIVPETSWGPHSFGLADERWARVQMTYETQQLGYPVWGISPSSTPDDTGNYEAYGATGLVWPYSEKKGLSLCYECSGPDQESTVTPHASFLALDVLPQEAFANIETLRADYPGVYGADGFFDAVNPTTHAVGHRYLVLDQSMIMAALDNVLNNRQLQRYFAQDPVSWAAQTYLSLEHFSLE